MARRGGRTVQKSDTDAVQEYVIALENKDRPQWTPEKRKEMADRFKQRGAPYHVVREKVVEWLRGNVPSGLIPNYLRFAMAAVKLQRRGAELTEFYTTLANIVVKNDLDIDVLKKMVENVEPLKNLKIDFDLLREFVETVRGRLRAKMAGG